MRAERKDRASFEKGAERSKEGSADQSSGL